MAVSLAELTDTVIIHNTNANATPEKDVRNGAVTLYAVYIDNSVVDAVPAFLKFYDDADPTVGTTDPDLIIEAEGNGTGDTSKLNDGDVFILVNGTTGIPFTTAMSYACVTAGGTAGTGDPAATVKVTLITN